MNSRRAAGGLDRLLPLISVALACASGSRPAEPPAAAPALVPEFGPVAAEVRRFILDTMRVLGAPGAAICVRKDGRVVWSEGFGYADLEQQVPVTTRTVGGTANLLIYPAERLIVALLVNSDRTFIGAIPRYAEPFLAR